MTLNELLYTLLHVCTAALIATVDNSGKRIPLIPDESFEGNLGTEGPKIPAMHEEEEVFQQQSAIVVEEKGSLILLRNASSPGNNEIEIPPAEMLHPYSTRGNAETVQAEVHASRSPITAEETNVRETFASQATEVTDV